MKFLRTVLAWFAGLLIVLWRSTCRFSFHNDPRPKLRQEGRPYIMVLLHAHNVSGIFINDERRLIAMISRSTDGDLLIPLLKMRRIHAVRGSTRTQNRDKGGRQALEELSIGMKSQVPGLLAVDGPKGPRYKIHRGVVHLARQTGAAIVPIFPLPSRRFILHKSWDRLQIPKPFSHIEMYCGEVIDPLQEPDDLQLRNRVGTALRALEARYDPSEATLASSVNSPA